MSRRSLAFGVLLGVVYIATLHVTIPFATSNGNPGWWFDNFGRALPSVHVYNHLMHTAGVLLGAAPVSFFAAWHFRSGWPQPTLVIACLASLWMLGSGLWAVWVLWSRGSNPLGAYSDMAAIFATVMDVIKVGGIPLGLTWLTFAALSSDKAPH